ncbi:MAG: tetratricopeptide repeat protein [Phototrophicaceae bacterium]
MPRLTQRLGLTRYEADEYYKEALRAYDNDDMNAAVLAMESAIDMLPTNSEYYAARGLFYLLDGEIDAASADFEESLRHYPYEVLAHYGLGVIAYDKRDMETALEQFTIAQRADPQRPETLYYLALVQHHRGENAVALDLMQQAHALFDQAGDSKNRTTANRWIATLKRLANESNQPRLPGN